MFYVIRRGKSAMATRHFLGGVLNITAYTIRLLRLAFAATHTTTEFAWSLGGASLSLSLSPFARTAGLPTRTPSAGAAKLQLHVLWGGR